MSIEKNIPNKLNHIGGGFTVTLNETMELIPTKGALGVYLYLSSKPQDWIVREKELQKRFNCGRDTIRTDLRTLTNVGLYNVIAIRDTSGKIVKWVTNLYKSPKNDTKNTKNNQITENPYSGEINQITEKPHSGFPDMSQNPTHTNEGLITKERITTNTSSDDDIKIGFYSFWTEYPKKVAKKDAIKAWKKINASKRELIIKDVISRKNNNWKSKEKQHIPNAASYLNGERWEDEIIAFTQISQPRSKFGVRNEIKSSVPWYISENDKNPRKKSKAPVNLRSLVR